MTHVVVGVEILPAETRTSSPRHVTNDDVTTRRRATSGWRRRRDCTTAFQSIEKRFRDDLSRRLRDLRVQVAESRGRAASAPPGPAGAMRGPTGPSGAVRGPTRPSGAMRGPTRPSGAVRGPTGPAMAMPTIAVRASTGTWSIPRAPRRRAASYQSVTLAVSSLSILMSVPVTAVLTSLVVESQ